MIQILPDLPPPRQRPRHRRIIAVSAVAAVVIAGVAAGLLARSSGAGSHAPAAGISATTQLPARGSSPSAGGSGASAGLAGSTAGPSAAPPPPTGPAFGHQAIWPFASLADAAAKQASQRNGHQPWRGGLDWTALTFVHDYLGYPGINKIVSRTVSGGDARVAVGFATAAGRLNTAAVLHLVQMGAGNDAPWEVVGTEDTTLTVTTPGYGAMAGSPMVVGGRITGADESLRVQLLSAGELLPPDQVAQVRGVPAGGENAQWSTRIQFDAVPGLVLTVAVSTGGHIAPVERFAVTSVTVTSPTTPPVGYQPLWPFAAPADALGYQQAVQYSHRPPAVWGTAFLDARRTALMFTQDILGYNGIDRVVSSTVSGQDARVAVGYAPVAGRLNTAAVLHLVRMGFGDNAPWEVVGTDDTTLTLSTPGYGARVSSPTTVGGRISGADESLRVGLFSVLNGVGESPGIPAGGQNTPWSTRVGFVAAPGTVLIIVVSTGGHVVPVERFAITGATVA